MCIVIRMVSPPLGKCGQPPAVVVQRLAAEATLPVYHDSTGFARITLIYKKKRPEPKFGSLFGAEDMTFPRTKKQSTGLFFAACGRPCCSSPQLRIPNKNPHGGVRHGDLCLVRKMGLEPTRHRHTHLKRACLPIPALPQIAFDCKKDSSTFGGIKSSPILQLFPAWGHLSKVSIYFYAQCQSWPKLYAHNRRSFLLCFVASYETSLFTWHSCTESPILYTSRKQQYGGLSVLHGIRL